MSEAALNMLIEAADMAFTRGSRFHKYNAANANAVLARDCASNSESLAMAWADIESRRGPSYTPNVAKDQAVFAKLCNSNEVSLAMDSEAIAFKRGWDAIDMLAPAHAGFAR